MRKQGKILRWDTARGFGFIRSPDTDADIYFHIKDFRSSKEPEEGEPVWFEEIHVGGKGPRAMAVQTGFSASPPTRAASVRQPASNRQKNRPLPHQMDSPQSNSGVTFFMLLMLAWLALISWAIATKHLPFWVAGLALGLNLLTFYMYWLDKYAAQKRQWRTKEDTLHLLSLLGGWPGAWFAQQILRHKSRKAAFRTTYWGTTVLHCSALVGWLFWLQPNLLLNQ